MTERDEELELQALQRRLDDAFETTRPRRGFEDELWLRMQQKRPFGSRLRDAVAGLLSGIRDAPAIPIAAVAVVLIAVVGIGFLSSGLSPFGNRQTMSSAAGGGFAPPHDNYLNGQRVPTPALHPGLVESGVPGQQTVPVSANGEASSNLYFGPANLAWTGTFPTANPAAPVLVYSEPGAGQKQTDSGRFGPVEGVTVATFGSSSQLPREPIFVITELNPGVAQGTDPTTAAGSFLAAHKVAPSWPTNVVVTESGGVTRVLFQRAFPVQNSDAAYLVNWNGDRYGIEVDIAGGRRTAIGPLPLSLQSAGYLLISNSQAAQLAVSQAPSSTAAIRPTPAVNLDHVELVYALAVANGNGFYEPAYLFSGSFSYNGQTYTKRVLVPLVDPSQRS